MFVCLVFFDTFSTRIFEFFAVLVHCPSVSRSVSASNSRSSSVVPLTLSRADSSRIRVPQHFEFSSCLLLVHVLQSLSYTTRSPRLCCSYRIEISRCRHTDALPRCFAIFLEFLLSLWQGESCSSAVSLSYSLSLRARTVAAALDTSRYSARIISRLSPTLSFIL